MRLFLAALSLIWFAGCGLLGLSSESLIFRTDAEEYSAGEIVRLSMENRSSHPFEMGNFCHARVERRGDDRWIRVTPPEGYGCTSELVILAPDERLEMDFRLYDDLEPGRYRLVHSAYVDIAVTEPISVVSNSFQVTS
ncbi:MAG: immunoglobulin-like domain-containing protein [Rubricoccaceae bacterium]|nr:immunoglobulin-like domain-containing protein [Rubricoccaceae bacterium]